MVDSEKLAGKSLRSTLEWCLAGFLSGEFACHINRRMFSSVFTTVGKGWFSTPIWTYTVNHLLSFHLCVPSLVMEVARRLVWRCLVDDPVLFFRTILEQFTKKDKQVSWKKIVLL